jgi:hypothetical protein
MCTRAFQVGVPLDATLIFITPRETIDTRTLKYTKMTHMRTNGLLDRMGSSAKFHDHGRAPSWTLHGHGNERVD